MRNRATALLAAVIAALVASLTFGAAPATADTYGWKWDHSPTFEDRTGSRYVRDALTVWDDPVSGIDVKVVKHNGEVTVDFETMPEGSGWAGYADMWVADGIAFGGHIAISTQFEGRYWCQNYCPSIAGHEAGHILGLAHTSDPAVPSMMQPVLNPSIKAPTGYDVTQIDGLYPVGGTTAAATLSSEQLSVTKIRKSHIVKVRYALAA